MPTSANPPPAAPPRFLYVACQHGAEASCKKEMLTRWPAVRFAFSRPGFLTFRLPNEGPPAPADDLACALARCHGQTLPDKLPLNADGAAAIWPIARAAQVDHVHLWSRESNWSSEPPPAVQAILDAFSDWVTEALRAAPSDAPPINRVARPNQRILDVIQVEPQECWTGLRTSSAVHQRWVGGAAQLNAPPGMISRAYLKMQEAPLWSKLPLRPGQRAAEIGCAPGGAAQALLEQGLLVTGVDPAEVHEKLLAHPSFTHIRKRGAHVARRSFANMDWLFSDTNVAPKYALDTIEHIVTHKSCRVQGMLLTLKLLEWKLAEEIPQYLERIQSWGFRYVKARQLSLNRQEVCVLALRRKHQRRSIQS